MTESKKKLKNILEPKLQLAKESRYSKHYYSAVIDYHEYICSSKELTPILQQIIAEDKIAPVYLREIFNDFLLSGYLKTEVKQCHHYPNFYTPEIEEKYKLMKGFVELLRNDYEEYKKHPNEVYFDPSIPIIKTDRDEEFYYIQKLHNDIIEKLEMELEETKQYLEFDAENSLLYFAGATIKISSRAQSDAHDLLRTIFKNKNKLWNNDEILDDWQITTDGSTPKKKVYQAGKAVNRIVAQETQIKDFLAITTKTVCINKRYLPN